MGCFANGPMISYVAIAAAVVVLSLNIILVLQACGLDLPFLLPN
jgi:hypothetical protein